jgi:hypothetical protein
MEYHLTDGRTIEDMRAAARDIGFNLVYLRENHNCGLAYLANNR